MIDRDNYVTIHVHNVSKKLARSASRVYLSRFGVGLTEWRIISVLAANEDVTATWICQSIDLDKAAASRSIRFLKEWGYVKSRSRDDGTRSAVIELTRKGVDLHDTLLPLSEQREALLLKGFSNQEKQTLLRMLKRLQANAAEMDEQDPDE